MLIKACLNGNRTRKEHDRIPLTPEELAEEAARTAAAGAGAVHIHPRAPDGAETIAPDACGAAVSAIRAAVPGLPVGVTSGDWIVSHPKRLDVVLSWMVRPDFVSINFSESGAEELCELCLRLDIGVEAGLTSVEDGRRLVDSDLANRCLRLLVEIDDESDPAQAASKAAAVEQLLMEADIAVSQLHHGVGFATWSVLERALDRGRDIRVGLEDTLVLPDGRRARDNAELISAAVDLARSRKQST